MHASLRRMSRTSDAVLDLSFGRSMFATTERPAGKGTLWIAAWRCRWRSRIWQNDSRAPRRTSKLGGGEMEGASPLRHTHGE